MEYPFEDKTALKHIEETKEQSVEEYIYEHDILLEEFKRKFQQLEDRVQALEDLKQDKAVDCLP